MTFEEPHIPRESETGRSSVSLNRAVENRVTLQSETELKPLNVSDKEPSIQSTT